MSFATVFYVYVGYPVALWVMTRRRRTTVPEPVSPTGSPPEASSVSIVVCALDEGAVIGQMLAHTRQLDGFGETAEIVVVADGSQDDTAAIARGFDGVIVLHQAERQGKAAALNRGAAAASGEILAFSDGNNLWEQGALVALLEPFRDPSVGGVTGEKVVLDESGPHAGAERLYWRYESHIRRMESALGTCTAANGEIMAIRAELFEPMPHDTVVDDLHIALGVVRRGYRFVLASDAISTEPAAASEREEHERRSRITAGRVALVGNPGALTSLPFRARWQFISHKFGRLLVPFAMMGMAVSSVTLALGSSRPGRGLARWLVGGQLGWYGIAAASSFLKRVLPRRLRTIVAIARYLTVSNLSILSGVVRALRGAQPATWAKAARTT